jgi:hypothetical protein
MGYSSHTGYSQVDSAINMAEGTRQSSVASAGGSQSAANNAEVAFYRGAKATLQANGFPFTHCTVALQQLGTGGV